MQFEYLKIYQLQYLIYLTFSYAVSFQCVQKYI